MHRIDSELEPDSREPGERSCPPQVETYLLRDREHDEAALEGLFRTEYDGLCDFVERYVRTSAVAEELVQDVFLSVWRRRATFPPATVNRAYLYASARNAALQHARHERVEVKWREAKAVAGSTEPSVQPSDSELVTAELSAAAERAIAGLPERCRLIFTLSRHQGLRYAEIAHMLGLSVGTVEVQMHRALQLLRSKLAPYLLLLLAAVR